MVLGHTKPGDGPRAFDSPEYRQEPRAHYHRKFEVSYRTQAAVRAVELGLFSAEQGEERGTF